MVAGIKSLASSLSIGTGAAVGREGPIIQIGASLGSTIGQFIPLAAWQRITLVAAGAGSGIAATSVVKVMSSGVREHFGRSGRWASQ